MSLVERFWEKVEKNGPVVRPELGPCWIWTASTRVHGYGQVGVGREDNGGKKTMSLAHRVSWRLSFGAITGGLCVLHRCDNPPCVNPDHLFLGTRQDNNADMRAKGRNRGGCPGATLQSIGLKTNSRSGFVGVNWCKRRTRWRARLSVGGVRLDLGFFHSPVAAALAYDAAAVAHYGTGAFRHFRVDSAVEAVILATAEGRT